MKKYQIGFVLSEVVIAISLVIILLGTTISLYDTNRAKAETLYEKMQDVSAGLLRMKADAACFPSKLAGMVNPMDGSDTFCGAINSNNWKGPYTDVGTRFGTDATNQKDVILEQINPNLSVFLEERVLMANTNAAGQPINEKKAWVLSTRGLNPEIQTQFLDYCSKLPVGSGVGSIEKSRCFKQADGQVGFLVDANEGWEQYYDVLINPIVVGDLCKGASCVPSNNAVPTVSIVDPCAANPAACTIVKKCPDGTAMPASGVCAIDPPVTKYCPNGTVMPASGICPAIITYCPDGMTVMPASGVCPTTPPPIVNPPSSSSTSSGGFSSSSSSSSSSSGMLGYRGSDGQLYSSPDAVPGTDDPCTNCNRELTNTYEKDVADAAGRAMSAASSIGGSISNALSSIGNALSSIAGSITSFFSSFFSGGGSSGGGGNTSSNSGQHADGSGGESGNNTSTTGHAGGCGSSGC